MHPVLIVLLVLAALVAVFLLVAATRPDTFRYERRATIAAPPAVVFGLDSDLRRFQDWSPWAKIDPQRKVVFSGPPDGVGAAFAWEGNRKVGAGSMTCTASEPAARAEFRLEFLRPMKVTNTAEFAFRAEGGGTAVVWSMTGKNNLFFKVFGLFVDCEKMIGKDFEKGLASMKALAEGVARG
jgi:hypothetical protein